MTDPTGEMAGGRLDFDRRLILRLHGAAITSNAGLLACHELDDALGLTAAAGAALVDARTSKSGRHAGYEDVDDVERLRRVPAIRWVVGDQASPESAEQWTKKSKTAVRLIRLSCRSFVANVVRPQLHALAYNLDTFLRALALAGEVERYSLTTLRERHVKISAKIASHGHYVTFHMAEVAVLR